MRRAFRYFHTDDREKLARAMAHADDVEDITITRVKVSRSIAESGYTWTITARGLGERAEAKWSNYLGEK